MRRQAAHRTFGFGVPATFAPHHFVVSIPRGHCQPVRITEDLGLSADSARNEVLGRAIIQRPAWAEIAGPTQRLFNKRLRSHGLATSRWKLADNPVDRLLGKELCVLAWAIEELDPQMVGTALRNWLALREEERWWLFGMTATHTGAPEDRGQGWRVALRYALGETPHGRVQR